MAAKQSADGEPDESGKNSEVARSLPDAAICGPGKRETVWVHGSVGAGPRGDGSKVDVVTRGSAEPEKAGEPAE